MPGSHEQEVSAHQNRMNFLKNPYIRTALFRFLRCLRRCHTLGSRRSGDFSVFLKQPEEARDWMSGGSAHQHHCRGLASVWMRECRLARLALWAIKHEERATFSFLREHSSCWRSASSVPVLCSHWPDPVNISQISKSINFQLFSTLLRVYC